MKRQTTDFRPTPAYSSRIGQTKKRRRPDPRRAKIHRSYTVEDVASLYGVHKNAVRGWIKKGLPVINDKRPMLILGQDLRDFLQTRRQSNKRPCGCGEIYCVKCRAPKVPAGNMADYQAVSDTQGTLVGMCPTCHILIYRRVSLAKLDQIRGQLDITMPKALRHINESTSPSLNCDLRQDIQP